MVATKKAMLYDDLKMYAKYLDVPLDVQYNRSTNAMLSDEKRRLEQLASERGHFRFDKWYSDLRALVDHNQRVNDRIFHELDELDEEIARIDQGDFEVRGIEQRIVEVEGIEQVKRIRRHNCQIKIDQLMEELEQHPVNIEILNDQLIVAYYHMND